MPLLPPYKNCIQLKLNRYSLAEIVIKFTKLLIAFDYLWKNNFDYTNYYQFFNQSNRKKIFNTLLKSLQFRFLELFYTLNCHTNQKSKWSKDWKWKWKQYLTEHSSSLNQYAISTAKLSCGWLKNVLSNTICRYKLVFRIK